MDEIKPYLFVHFKDNIKTVLQQPVIHTQRIKYVSCDISPLYIVLGASSGGLYIFRREPCTFIQLVPNQEGAVTSVSISLNEKYIAYSTVKKLLSVLQFSDTNKLFNKNIYREQFDAAVVCMKWNIYSTELFLGDVFGQIYVVVIGEFLAKTMFQSSCYPLMRLDSRIVQLDWNSNLLLVSTTSRCYICDTDREEYRQIGQKLRDGDFGACFLNRNESDTSIILNSTENKKKNWFITKSLESDTSTWKASTYYQQLKIYCSRPGGRVWEVNVDGIVLKTLQYKDELASTSVTDIVYHNNYDTKLRLEMLAQDVPSTIEANFSLLYVIKKQFLVTFKKNYLFVLDSETTSIIAWCFYSQEICDIRIIGSAIYIWDANISVSVIHFTDIEKFIMRAFINKQYLLCADICRFYRKNLLRLIPSSNKLYLLSTLKDKLEDNSDIIRDIEPVLKCIENVTGRRQNAQALATGMYIVDNAFYSLYKTDIDEPKKDVKLMNTLPVSNKHKPEEKTPQIETKLFSSILTNRDKSLLTNGDLKEIVATNGDQISEQELVINKYELDKDSKSSQQLNYLTNKVQVNKLESVATVVDFRPIVEKPKIKRSASVETLAYPNIACIEKPLKALSISQSKTAVNPHIDILHQYFKLSKVSKTYTCQAIDDILRTFSNINAVYKFLSTLFTHMMSLEDINEDTNCKLWCYNLFLRFIKLTLEKGLASTSAIQNNIYLAEILKSDQLMSHFINAFKELNSSTDELCCDCGFPLPSAVLFSHIRYFNIGQTIIELLWQKDNKDVVYSICKSVPFMWKTVVPFIMTEPIFLSLLIQYNDLLLIEFYLYTMSSNEVSNLITTFIELQKNSRCLRCNREISTAGLVNWNKFSHTLLKALGGETTLKYLMTAADLIPNGAIEPQFYQMCLLSQNVEDFTRYSRMAELNPQKFVKELEDLIVVKCKEIGFEVIK